MSLIFNTLISTIVTITTFAFLVLRGGFPAIRINIIPASITNDDGTIQNITVNAFAGYHVQNLIYGALIAILIGIVFSVGIKEMYSSFVNDIAKRRKG